MKQSKKIEIIEQLSTNEMASVKGGFSFNTPNGQSSEEATHSKSEDIYIYIDGKRYRITTKGLEPA